MWRWNPYQDEWFDQIERLSHDNPKPFKAWFPPGEDRIYIPFVRLAAGDQDVIELLQEEGYEVINYRDGYCRRPGSNIQKIGRVLGRLKKQALRELEQKHKAGILFNILRERRKTNKYFDDIIKQFTSSKYRGVGRNRMVVVISQNPHDIARMSTERDWESCMTLPTEEHEAGAHHKSVLKEVESGGLIAYLIYDHDRDIDRPLSRIHIRRFENREGSSIAVAEKSVYGLEVAGFAEVVDAWLEEKQGTVAPGFYRLQGGGYSDSFSKTMLVPPDDMDTLISWMRGEGLDDIPYTVWVVIPLHDEDDYEDDPELSGEQKFETPLQAQMYVDYHPLNEHDYWRERYIWHENGEEIVGPWAETDEDGEYTQPAFEIEELTIDDRPEMQLKAAMELLQYPELPYEIVREIWDFANSVIGYRSTPLKRAILFNYSQYLTQEELNSFERLDFEKYLKSLTPEEREPYLYDMAQNLLTIARSPADFYPPCMGCGEKIDIANDNIVQCDRRLVFHHADCVQHDIFPNICARMRWQDEHRNQNKKPGWHHSDYNYASLGFVALFRPLMDYLRPLPQELIEALVMMPQLVPVEGKYLESLHARICHLFAMTDSDTPTVQLYYSNLLPYWEYEFESYNLSQPKEKLLRTLRRELGIDSLGFAIAKLGENGKRFLPFLHSRVEKLREDFGDIIFNPMGRVPEEHRNIYELNKLWNDAFFVAERYLYIIDSIENGRGHSTKYGFFEPISRR